ncbi:MAG: 3-dehydroquinate synthase [Dehalococcoidia bacterium]|nr:3-dehydroquinate synthase [Dehalococcoidia bacterium]
MGKRTSGNIFLTGFSYTGKTQVSQLVAKRLGWKLVDTDDEIVRLAGKPIPEIFAQDGEEHFRKLERQALANVCRRKSTVVATGGGIIMAPENRQMMRGSGAIICLEAQPETIHRRLLIDSANSKDKVVRPLLASPDPLARIISLKQSRQNAYVDSDWTVHTDHLTEEEVATEVIRGWNYICKGAASKGAASSAPTEETAAVVTTATESYPIFVGWGILDTLGQRMKDAGLSGSAYVISEDHVFPLYGERAEASLRAAGFTVASFVVPFGEKSKSIEIAKKIYDFLVERRAERGHAIVALGGGVIGDLAGFVAATFLRGMPLVQVPTSLMAMVDSSIGGKTAINHPQGKNLIGAFHQPRLVLSDVEALSTLPERELISGWAEVIKHGLIRDAEFFEFLEKNQKELTRLDRKATTEAIKKSAAIKAAVVSEDEKESGIRTLLNYGHTIAHGLETASGYGQLLHGEAVAIGIMGAARIAEQVGLLGRDAVERQNNLFRGFGLPVVSPDVDPQAVLKAIELDKKVQKKSVRWVLLEEIGRAIVRADVPPEVVRGVVGNYDHR